MYYYKTKIMYEGTLYAGFQWQKDLITVQSEFNAALAKILPGKFTTMAASRTDTGVHALAQIVKISSTTEIDLSTFVNIFNNSLPPQIRCYDISSCLGTFRPSAEAKLKEYRYFFTNQSKATKEDQQFIANISNKLDFNSMMICLQALKGKHDFCNFYSSGSNVRTTVREIFVCELTEINPHDIFKSTDILKIPVSIDKCYQLRIEANGFLKQMIRHIVSALWMVGSGKLTTKEFIDFLNAQKSEKQLWKVAPPNGLFLYRII